MVGIGFNTCINVSEDKLLNIILEHGRNKRLLHDEAPKSTRERDAPDLGPVYMEKGWPSSEGHRSIRSKRWPPSLYLQSLVPRANAIIEFRAEGDNCTVAKYKTTETVLW